MASRIRTKVWEGQPNPIESLPSNSPKYPDYKFILDRLTPLAPLEKSFNREENLMGEDGKSLAKAALKPIGTSGTELAIEIAGKHVLTITWTGDSNTPILFSPKVCSLAFLVNNIASLFPIDLRSSRDEVRKSLASYPVPDLTNWTSMSVNLGTPLAGVMADFKGICAQLFTIGALNTSLHFDLPRDVGVDTLDTLVLHPNIKHADLLDVTVVGFGRDVSSQSVPVLAARVCLVEGGVSEFLCFARAPAANQIAALPKFLSLVLQKGLGLTPDDIRAIANPKTQLTLATQVEQRGWYDIGPKVILIEFLDKWLECGGTGQYGCTKEFLVNIRPDPRSDLVTPYKVRVTFTSYCSSQGVESPGVNVVFGPADTPEKHKLFVNCAGASGAPSRLSAYPAPSWLIQAILASVTCQLMAEIEKRKLSEGDPLGVAELRASLGLDWSTEA